MVADGKKLKPDLVAYGVDHIVVIDVQIINNQYPLNIAHKNKIDKYLILKSRLQDQRLNGVFFMFVTYKWRGLLAANSAEFLKAFLFLN